MAPLVWKNIGQSCCSWVTCHLLTHQFCSDESPSPPSLCLGASISTIACVTRHFVLTTHLYFSILLLLDPTGKELIYFHSPVVLVPQEQGLIWTIMLVRAAIYWAFEQTRHLPEALLFWAALGLWCFESFSLFAESRAYSLPVVCRLLFEVVSLFAEHGL